MILKRKEAKKDPTIVFGILTLHRDNLLPEYRNWEGYALGLEYFDITRRIRAKAHNIQFRDDDGTIYSLKSKKVRREFAHKFR